jgi:hypothetical protein
MTVTALLQSRIDTEIAAVPRIVPTPTGTLGYGTDLDCESDMTETASSTSDPYQVLAQFVFHLVTTTKGMLPGDSAEEKGWGLNLLDMIGQDTGRANARDWSVSLRTEILKDERFSDAQATVTSTGTINSPAFDVPISLTPADYTLSPFRLVLAVTPLDVFLVTVEATA